MMCILPGLTTNTFLLLLRLSLLIPCPPTFSVTGPDNNMLSKARAVICNRGYYPKQGTAIIMLADLPENMTQMRRKLPFFTNVTQTTFAQKLFRDFE